jgi:hypothetical protein
MVIKIIIIFYFIYCACANYKCCIMPSRSPNLENKISCILYIQCIIEMTYLVSSPISLNEEACPCLSLYTFFSIGETPKREIPMGRTRRAPPLKLEKIWFFCRKFVIFHTKKIPQKFSRLPPQSEKIRFFGVKSWFFTRNTPKMFAPPSARRNFFKCAPPNLKSWIRPWYIVYT